MDDSKVIVLKNTCDEILAILTVYGKDKEDVENKVVRVFEIFKKVMEEKEDCWDIEDLVSDLQDSDISFSWSTDFKERYI